MTSASRRRSAGSRPTAEIGHRVVEPGSIRMHIAEAGSGPLVVLLHGFPEFWYSWRHQLPALAGAGFHAVAPDQHGYGRTDRPNEVERYTMLHLVGDVVGLMDALGEERAVVAGHDWGAPVAWNAALMRPDRIRGVIALSIPYRPRGSAPPLHVMRSRLGERFYMVYVQRPGVADAELARDVAATFRRSDNRTRQPVLVRSAGAAVLTSQDRRFRGFSAGLRPVASRASCRRQGGGGGQ